jgi:hypothetical protein
MNIMRFASVAVAMITLSGSVLAESNFQWTIGVQQKNWQEFDENGERLLKETGPLLELGMRYQLRSYYRTGLISAKVYGGSLDYDGHTWGGEPVSTSSKYLGASLEYLAANAIIRDDPMWTFQYGAGVDGWNREIHNTDLGVDQKETYLVLSAKAGVGFNYHNHMLSLGVKYPVYAHSKAAALPDSGMSDASLSLGRKITPYLAFETSLSRNTRFTLAYEAYNFTKSAPVRVSPDVVVYQPETTTHIITAGVAF